MFNTIEMPYSTTTLVIPKLFDVEVVDMSDISLQASSPPEVSEKLEDRNSTRGSN
jgi:hypothetical protein